GTIGRLGAHVDLGAAAVLGRQPELRRRVGEPVVAQVARALELARGVQLRELARGRVHGRVVGLAGLRLGQTPDVVVAALDGGALTLVLDLDLRDVGRVEVQHARLAGRRGRRGRAVAQ